MLQPLSLLLCRRLYARVLRAEPLLRLPLRLPPLPSASERTALVAPLVLHGLPTNSAAKARLGPPVAVEPG
jgi:hypothetical protein